MELNYWASTEAKSAAYDEATREWTVTVEREGRPMVLHPAQLVLATGMSGKPNLPSFPGMDLFRGDQHHSSAHPGPDAYRTMVQRSSTHIVKSDSLMEIGVGALYSEQAVASGMTTEKADMVFASLPYRIMHEFQIPLYDQMRERDKDFYDRLESVGFVHDWGDDGSGLFMKYLRRGSGYYIDVGAGDLAANGDVKLVNGQVDHLTESAVVLEDGTELPADLVVYATGYGSMNGWAAGPDLAGGGRQGRQVLGPGLGHHQGPRAVGRRAAQHVEADAAGSPVVPWRQSASVPALLALPGAAAQGPRRHPDAGVRAPAGAPPPLRSGRRPG
jgi:putative flavoprotein involved in K+ transport